MQAPHLFNNNSDRRGKYGLVHNVGLGGAVVCSLLRRPEFYDNSRSDTQPDGRTRCVCVLPLLSESHSVSPPRNFHNISLTRDFVARLGYNHAHECKPITMADVDKVKSRKNSPYVLAAARL
jgi:sterol carrier protein 2